MLDLQLIFYLRNKHPGASAIKFLSQLEIFIFKFICWYDGNDIGNPKILKQKLIELLLKNTKLRRYLFEKKYNKSLTFHEDINIENCAKKEMLSYI